VLFLELHGRKITERRVQSAGVVYFVDEARKPRDHVGMSSIVTQAKFAKRVKRPLTMIRMWLTIGYGLSWSLAARVARPNKPRKVVRYSAEEVSRLLRFGESAADRAIRGDKRD
jgi:hypothetical protein